MIKIVKSRIASTILFSLMMTMAPRGIVFPGNEQVSEISARNAVSTTKQTNNTKSCQNSDRKQDRRKTVHIFSLCAFAAILTIGILAAMSPEPSKKNSIAAKLSRPKQKVVGASLANENRLHTSDERERYLKNMQNRLVQEEKKLQAAEEAFKRAQQHLAQLKADFERAQKTAQEKEVAYKARSAELQKKLALCVPAAQELTQEEAAHKNGNPDQPETQASLALKAAQAKEAALEKALEELEDATKASHIAYQEAGAATEVAQKAQNAYTQAQQEHDAAERAVKESAELIKNLKNSLRAES